jgi:hypothetical protein
MEDGRVEQLQVPPLHVSLLLLLQVTSCCCVLHFVVMLFAVVLADDNAQERGGSIPVAAAAEALHVQLPLFRRKFNEVRLRRTCGTCRAARDTSCSCFLEMSSPFAAVRRRGGRFCFWWRRQVRTQGGAER